jgi:hypothetical protein
MDATKLQLKIYARPDKALSVEAFIPVFHRWIKDRVLADDTLVDVANYAHVPHGPGVVLIGHGVDYFMDEGDGRLGLLFNRKRAAAAAPLADQLTDAFRRAIHAARLLEGDPALAGLSFATDEWLFRINDRLLAPNSDQSHAAVTPTLQAFCARVFPGAKVELSRSGTTRTLFAIRIATNPAPTLAAVLERLGGPIA